MLKKSPVKELDMSQAEARNRLAENTSYVSAVAENRTDRRVSWEWNIPLLLRTSVASLLLVIGFVALYVVQSKRIANSISTRIVDAEETGDVGEQLKWLKRYVSLVPRDFESLNRLAVLTDESANDYADFHDARRRLSAAIAVGDEVREVETHDLRKRLIPRLLQLETNWAIEAERQIKLLGSEEGDPETTKWLAKALASQRGDSRYLHRNASKFDRRKEYWEWLANQPTGEVYYQAVSANSTDVALISEFVRICIEFPEWLFPPGAKVDQSLVDSRKDESLQLLKGMKNDGHARYVVFKMISDERQSREFAESEVPNALSRLAKFFSAEQESATDSASSSEKLTSLLDDVANQREEYESYWDWQLALESATLLAQSKPQLTENIYERLLSIDNDQVRRQQREQMYLQYGFWLYEQENKAEAKRLWTTGAEVINESLDLVSAIGRMHAVDGDIAEAQKYISEFQRIVEVQEERLDGPEGIRLTKSFKESDSRTSFQGQMGSEVTAGSNAALFW